MTDFLPYLLLVPAVWFGWWVAKNYQGRITRRRNRLFNDQYFQGLNYLLNEQPDKAIQVFLELADVNQDTVETHLALGNLFRRRGEVDRAIRFHQNIIAKPGLLPDQRTQALLELGEDYMRAGLLDRAERLFAGLIESDEQTPSALRSLLEIYQQEKDWAKALEQADRLQQVEGTHQGGLMAQFCCELAEQALAEGNVDLARKHLRQARRHHPESIRARFIMARMLAASGDDAGALDAYEEIAALDAEYIPALLDDYVAAAERAGALSRARDRLREWHRDYDGISLVLKLTDWVAAEQGSREAGRFLAEALNRRPSVRGLDRLIDMRGAGHLQAALGDEILKAVAARLMARQPRYRCNHCGFSGHAHHWQCPSCRRWDTTRIVHGVLGE